ncbi:caffeic acid 3-O-methyltransferase-like isoform X2 [Asparagus officinalis]|uniref:caffeic acid 3-O-methyltransferase-like isoform X2 n=1 Tax=Asparagus officinalis TaxID=4686 RepID=UPI00098E049D|nr:caffeic acid 3-O-methyltransferase-like isoform X2 [Asparagus officinalis]
MDPVQNLTTLAPQITTDEDAFIYAHQLVSFSVLPMTLTSAIDLGIFDIIAKAGPGASLSPGEIAAQLPTKNPEAASMLDRMMRLLASYSVLTCTVEARDDGGVERKYGAAPVVKYLAKNEDGVSIAAMALNQDRVFMESWYYLKDAVLNGGIPFIKAHGMGAFEYLGTDPRANKVYNEGVNNYSTILTKKILETYKGFDDLKVLVDVGGGVGGTLKMILQKHSHIKGINIDLPHVISEAEPIPGVEHVTGDIFECVPSGDGILIKILRNCWKALPEDGKVIIMNSMIPVDPKPIMANQEAILLDLILMAKYPGGKERTENEFHSLAKRAGFSGSEIIYGFANNCMIEFYK